MSKTRNLAKVFPDTNGRIPNTNLGAGTILQVVQGTLTTPVVLAATGIWLDIGLQATITPIRSNSIILIRADIAIGGNTTSYDAGLGLWRNESYISVATDYGNRFGCFLPLNQRNQSLHETSTVNGSYMDIPGITTAVTYKIKAYSVSQPQYINRSSSDDNSVNDTRHGSIMTLMEIAQ